MTEHIVRYKYFYRLTLVNAQTGSTLFSVVSAHTKFITQKRSTFLTLNC